MIASLLKRTDGTYYCSNCMMRQMCLRPTCYFCEYEFSNWASIALKIFKEEERKKLILFNEEEIKNSR